MNCCFYVKKILCYFKLALVYIDIDNFKLINDTFGHKTGDLLLSRVVKVIQGAIRFIDILARAARDCGIILQPFERIVCCGKPFLACFRIPSLN